MNEALGIVRGGRIEVAGELGFSDGTPVRILAITQTTPPETLELHQEMTDCDFEPVSDEEYEEMERDRLARREQQKALILERQRADRGELELGRDSEDMARAVQRFLDYVGKLKTNHGLDDEA